MLARLLILLDRYRRVVLAAVLLAVGVAAYLATKVEILDSPERWTPQTTQEAWQVFDRHFDTSDSILVGVHFRRPVTDDDLPRLRRLREKLEQIEGMKQVYDCSLVAERIEAVPLTTLLDPAEADRFSLYAAGLWDAPHSDGGRTLLTICEMGYNVDQNDAVADETNTRRRRVAASVEQIVAEEQQSGGWGRVKFHVASAIVVMLEMERHTRQIAYTFLPASIVVGLLSLLIGFRSWRAILVAVVGSAVAMLLVLGWLGGGGGTLGAVTMAAPTLMSIVGIATAVHFAAYAAEHPRAGRRFPRTELIRAVGIPCLGAAATTGVGFLMLRFNELLPMRDLGYQLFAGSLLAFLGVFVASQWIPLGKVRTGLLLTPANCRRWGQAVSRQPRTVSLLTFVLIAMLGFFAWPRGANARFGVYFDADPFAFFDDEQPIAQALQHFSDHKFGVYQLEVVLVPKEPVVRDTGLLAPPSPAEQANRQAAVEFTERIAGRQDLGVSRVVSTYEFEQRYEEFQRQLMKVRDEQGWLGFVAQLGRYTTSANIFNQTFQAWHRDKQGVGALRITFLAHNRSDGFGPLIEEVRSVLPTERFDCYLTGSIAQNVDLAEGLGGGMLWGLGTSLLVMAALCFMIFRSLRLTLIAALPNFFPILAIYGGLGLFRIPLNCGSAMVLTIALGIALNDTIHFLLHYRRLTRNDGLATRPAVEETIEHLGRPIVLTSLVHIAGFLIFLLTDFQPLYHFGLLSSITMIVALVGDLVLLPNLLLVFDNVPAKPGVRERAVEVTTAARAT